MAFVKYLSQNMIRGMDYTKTIAMLRHIRFVYIFFSFFVMSRFQWIQPSFTDPFLEAIVCRYQLQHQVPWCTAILENSSFHMFLERLSNMPFRPNHSVQQRVSEIKLSEYSMMAANIQQSCRRKVSLTRIIANHCGNDN